MKARQCLRSLARGSFQRDYSRGPSVVWVAFVALAHKNDHVVERQWILFSRGQVVEELVDRALLISQTALTRNDTETETEPVQLAARSNERTRSRTEGW
jgi:hypothetical protein